MNSLVEVGNISTRVYNIRGMNVMMDRDLAHLYGVETRVLKQAVRRNIERFPSDFMFELSDEEFQNWRSHYAISNDLKMGLRHTPMVFTELGVSMLSSVLKSDQAIKTNIQIMRVLSKMKTHVLDTKELKREIDELKNITDQRFQVVFEALDQVLHHDNTHKEQIGFIKGKSCE